MMAIGDDTAVFNRIACGSPGTAVKTYNCLTTHRIACGSPGTAANDGPKAVSHDGPRAV